MVISTRSIVEGAFLVSIAVIMYVLGIYNAAIGLVTSLFCPIPIILLVIRHESKVALLGLIVSGLLLSSMVGIFEAIMFLLQFFIPGYVMGYFIKKESSPQKVIAMSTVVFVLCTLIFSLIMKQVMQKDIIGESVKELEVSIKQGLNMFAVWQEKNLDKTNAAAAKEQLDQLYNIVKVFMPILPGLFICSVFMVMFVNYEIARRIINRLGHTIKPIDLFSIKVPDYLIWGFIISFIFSMFKIDNFIVFPYISEIRLFFENITIIFVMAYLIQGMCIAIVYMKKWKFPGFFIAANIILFMLTNLWILFLLIGVFDFWFDFRTRLIKSQEIQNKLGKSL